MASFGERVRELMTERGMSLRALAKAIPVDPSHLSRVVNGHRPASAELTERLDTELGAAGELVAFTKFQVVSGEPPGQLSAASPGGSVVETPSMHDEDDAMYRRAAMQLLAALSAGAAIPADTMKTFLSGLERAFGDRDDYSLDDWEETIWEYGYLVFTGPLGALIPDLTADLMQVKHLLDRRQPPPVRAELSRVAARLASILAGELGDTRHRDASVRAYRTARRAADASGDRDLAVRIRAGQAGAAFWSGEPAQVVTRLAGNALRVANGAPSAGLAKAHEIRARALSTQRGNDDEARAAVHKLGEVFDRLPANVIADKVTTWGFPEHLVRSAEAYVYTMVGDRQKASRATDQALALYPPGLVHGIANLRLTQAIGLARDGDVTEGLDLAMRAGHGLPVNTARRRNVGSLLAVLPEKAHTLPAARELHALT